MSSRDNHVEGERQLERQNDEDDKQGSQDLSGRERGVHAWGSHCTTSTNASWFRFASGVIVTVADPLPTVCR
jgi:hypothetical protein